LGIATLSSFILHLDQRRMELRDVKVVRTTSMGRPVLTLVGTVTKESESIASESSNLVLITKNQRLAIVRLVSNHKGEILAFEGGELLGTVVWDNNTNARKLPFFMRGLLGMEP